jgi:hypothetical protein
MSVQPILWDHPRLSVMFCSLGTRQLLGLPQSVKWTYEFTLWRFLSSGGAFTPGFPHWVSLPPGHCPFWLTRLWVLPTGLFLLAFPPHPPLGQTLASLETAELLSSSFRSPMPQEDPDCPFRPAPWGHPQVMPPHLLPARLSTPGALTPRPFSLGPSPITCCS